MRVHVRVHMRVHVRVHMRARARTRARARARACARARAPGRAHARARACVRELRNVHHARQSDELPRRIVERRPVPARLRVDVLEQHRHYRQEGGHHVPAEHHALHPRRLVGARMRAQRPEGADAAAGKDNHEQDGAHLDIRHRSTLKREAKKLEPPLPTCARGSALLLDQISGSPRLRAGGEAASRIVAAAAPLVLMPEAAAFAGGGMCAGSDQDDCVDWTRRMPCVNSAQLQEQRRCGGAGRTWSRLLIGTVYRWC
eukprot:6192797-Pleurochrysis_carterae.AAC.1